MQFKNLLTFVLLSSCLSSVGQNYNPFEAIGKQADVVTLSNGKYVEFFDMDTIQRIGTVLFNIRQKKIVRLLNADSIFMKVSDNSSVSRWYSVDPKANEFSFQSPYTAMDNSPILKNDPTGASGEVTIDKKSKTVTVTSNITFYGSAASPVLAKQTAADIQNSWNGANGKVKIGGVEYGVKFQVTGTYDANLSASTIKSNTDIKNNYIKIVSSDIDVSGMDQVGINPGANTGVFLLSDISGANTQTEGHEFGHGLAAVSGTLDGHPDFFDQRGHGQPGIMYPKGTPVDAPYTYDPSKGASSLDKKTGKVTNAMNPSKRKANQEDINYLNIDKLKFDTKGKAQLGKLTNTVH